MEVEVDCAMLRVHGERICENECERRGIEEQYNLQYNLNMTVKNTLHTIATKI